MVRNMSQQKQIKQKVKLLDISTLPAFLGF